MKYKTILRSNSFAIFLAIFLSSLSNKSYAANEQQVVAQVLDHQNWLSYSMTAINEATNQKWKTTTNCELPFDALLLKDKKNILLDCDILHAASQQIEVQAILIVIAMQHVESHQPVYHRPSTAEKVLGTVADVVARDPEHDSSKLGNHFPKNDIKRPRQSSTTNIVATKSIALFKEMNICLADFSDWLNKLQEDTMLNSGHPVRRWVNRVKRQFGSTLYHPDRSCTSSKN